MLRKNPKLDCYQKDKCTFKKFKIYNFNKMKMKNC